MGSQCAALLFLRAAIDDIAMNLVGEKQRAVPQAQIRKPAELLPGPDTAHGVMGAAEDHGLRAIFEGRLDTSKVHKITALRPNEGR